MWKSFAVAFLSFPFTALAFAAGWALADVRTGLLAGAAMFTVFFLAAAVNLFFVKSYSYADALLPAAFAALWSLALAPFSLGLSVFSAPAFIASGMLLGACMAAVKRWPLSPWMLALPAAVFIYEMLPVNIPGFVDDTLALGGAFAVVLRQAVKDVLPLALKEMRERARQGTKDRAGGGR